jgi:chromosome segregation ATPase
LQAKNRLQQIQADLANVKLREPVDDFRSACVEEQIARLDAALDLKEVRTKMDAAVAEAKKLPANASKTDAEIRQKLAEAQKSFREMQAQYEIANHNLQAAENTITSIRQEIQKLGGVLPK